MEEFESIAVYQLIISEKRCLVHRKECGQITLIRVQHIKKALLLGCGDPFHEPGTWREPRKNRMDNRGNRSWASISLWN